MKRLLLSLCLVGAVFPGHNRLALQTAQGPPTPVEQPIEARAVFALPGTAVLGSMSHPQIRGSNTRQFNRLRWWGGMRRRSLPEAEISSKRLCRPPAQSLEPSESPVNVGENEGANWVVVIRGATVHSGPSVSAPMVRFYSVGTELHLTDYQHGWFQVLDPVTSQRGGYTRSTISKQFVVLAKWSPPCKSRQSKKWLTRENPLRS